jgi:hypothetical protein
MKWVDKKTLWDKNNALNAHFSILLMLTPVMFANMCSAQIDEELF